MSGRKKAAAWAVFVAAIAGGLPAVAGCRPVPIACAGQCQPPFELLVIFQPHASPGAVSSELRQCSRGDANVIRVAELPPANGYPRAAFYTHSMAALGRDRLQKCLAAEPDVRYAAWPS